MAEYSSDVHCRHSTDCGSGSPNQVIISNTRLTLKSMKERKSPFSAYFKILTNHFHLILLTASFELSWPQLIADYFKSAEPVANVSDRIISIDCFLDQSSKSL